MTRKIGKTPVKRIRVEDKTWQKFEKLKKEKETWNDFLEKLIEEYEQKCL